MKFQSSLSIVFLLFLVNNSGATTEDATTNTTEESEVILSSPQECARTCVAGEPPKTCYYHFTLENYDTLNGACQVCIAQPNNTFTGECQCIVGDGIEKSLMTINRMYPGPRIEVCLGDKIVVDVENKIEGNEVTIHWHGLWQIGTPHMDGVPMVNQCPIHQGQTFRYQYLANNSGTHFYHSHVGLQKLNGICGALIVREFEDIYRELYDCDDTTTVMFVSDSMHELGEEKFPGRLQVNVGQTPSSLLFNGKGRYTDPDTGYTTNAPLEVFTVKKGKSYRFRFINALSSVCPTQLNIEGHNFTIIATDGIPVEPVTVDTLISFTGERYDFILNAHDDVGTYWIQLRGLAECGIDETQQLAILRYEDGPDYPPVTAPDYKEGLPVNVVLNPLDGLCHLERKNAICISQLKNAEKEIDEDLLNSEPDLKIWLGFQGWGFNSSTMYQPRTFLTNLLGGVGGGPGGFEINGIIYSAPSSPILSQYANNQYCNATNKPDNCNDDEPCYCTHTYNIPYNAKVQIAIIDKQGAGNLSHPYHMHGYAFHVVGMGRSNLSNNTKDIMEALKELDEEEALGLNFDKAPRKDTIPIPENGYVVLKFRANNLGSWFFHCHFLYHTAVGMDTVLNVGTPDEWPKPPENFPQCHSFQPKITPAK